jgi:hypothetical protein
MIACTPKELAKALKEKVLRGELTADDIAKMLPKEKAELKAILEDFVTDKLKVNVTSEEIGVITKKAKKISEAERKLKGELGNPKYEKENIEFFKAKKEMDDYLLAKNPASNLRILTGTVGRGMMLFSLKSPILNIGSNIEIGFAEALSRRINNLDLRGTDNKLALDYVKMVNKIYQKTGYDISRMENIKDTGVGGERVLGETIHSQGKGPVRKVGRIVEDVVFKQLMGAPDTAFASAHFADSVNLNALKLTKGDKVKAREVMEDSMRIEPTTIEGKLLREQGILDAQKATWTNTSTLSKFIEGIRGLLNRATGDLRAGDYFLPFIKTPANVIATGMDYAGMGIPKALIKTLKAVKNGEFGNKEHIQSMSRDLVRSGLGITSALIIANQLKDEDFVGAYDQKRSQIEQLRNSSYNAVRIGDKWISMDWFGPLSIPISSIMYARKYGETPGAKTFQYGVGVVFQLKNLPGISEAYDFVKSKMYKQNQSLEEMTGDTKDYILGEAYSRLVPSFLSDIAKATDTKERQTGGTTVGTIQSKIPVFRQMLPEKKTIFGESIPTENGWQTVIFGSRIKTDRENKISKELSDVSSSTDKGIAFTDWDKSSSKTLAQFKQKVGQKTFDNAKLDYGKYLKQRLTEIFNKNDYKKLSNEEKLNVINGLDTEAMNKIFKNYNFKYKAPETKKIKL